MRIEGIIGYSGLQLFKEEFDIEKYGFNAESIHVECNILLSRFDVEVFNERFCWERLNAIKRLMDMGFFEEALTLSFVLEITEASGERFLVIYKSVPQLIMQLLSCADGAYREAGDKSKFETLLLN